MKENSNVMTQKFYSDGVFSIFISVVVMILLLVWVIISLELTVILISIILISIVLYLILKSGVLIVEMNQLLFRKRFFRKRVKWKTQMDEISHVEIFDFKSRATLNSKTLSIYTKDGEKNICSIVNVDEMQIYNIFKTYNIKVFKTNIGNSKYLIDKQHDLD